MFETIEQYANDFIANPKSEEFTNKFVDNLRDTSGLFVETENVLFDYKDKFPDKNDKSHMASFYRIALAFYNTFGGVLVLGVNNDGTLNEDRSKNISNIENFNKDLREICNHDIGVKRVVFSISEMKVKSELGKDERLKKMLEFAKRSKVPDKFMEQSAKKKSQDDKNLKSDFASNKNEAEEEIELLIVPKRPSSKAPAYLIKDVDKYKIGTIFIRRGPEVFNTTSADISFLFSNRDLGYDENPSTHLTYLLPQRPNTIEKFVGRVSILAELLTWITSEDEPRKFLWGRGGSGKSTIAFEFARNIVRNGAAIKTVNNTSFDRVIFISAKEKRLRTDTAEITDVDHTDFTSLEEQLIAIAEAANYSDDIDYKTQSMEELIGITKEIFDFESLLLIIDDIDTLTTKGTDPGKDLLYKLAIKAKETIRILYTQRNKEIENSIEVPGFKDRIELDEFIKNCCAQFGVELPSKQFIDNELIIVSEGIPLIVETLIGLRKNSGSYSNSLKIFKERGGKSARDYLFQREYDALSLEKKSREILCLISEFGRPVIHDEILAILHNVSEDTVVQGIAEVSNFFLTTGLTTDGQTTYKVNPVTSIFLKNVSENLNIASAIKERVKGYKAKGKHKPQLVAIIENKVQRLLDKSRPNEALELIKNETNPEITENVHFKSLSGIVYSKQIPPSLTDARECFEFCLIQNHEDLAALRQWYIIEEERNLKQIEICDRVINSKKFIDSSKNEFKNRKADANYYYGVGLGVNFDSYEYFKEAFRLRNETFLFFQGRGQLDPKEDQRLESLGFRLVNIATQEKLFGDIWKLFKQVSIATDGLIEPCKRPLFRLIENLQKISVPHEKETSILGHINQVNADIKRNQFRCERDADKEQLLNKLELARKKRI